MKVTFEIMKIDIRGNAEDGFSVDGVYHSDLFLETYFRDTTDISACKEQLLGGCIEALDLTTVAADYTSSLVEDITTVNELLFCLAESGKPAILVKRCPGNFENAAGE